MSGPLPDAHAPQLPAVDVCRFLPQLATELATAQTTQNEEVEQKQNQLLQLQVYTYIMPVKILLISTREKYQLPIFFNLQEELKKGER